MASPEAVGVTTLYRRHMGARPPACNETANETSGAISVTRGGMMLYYGATPPDPAEAEHSQEAW